MKVEHKVQLTDVAEVVVQNFHKEVDALKVRKFIVCNVYAHREEQTSISPIYDLVCLELQAAPLLISESSTCQVSGRNRSELASTKFVNFGSLVAISLWTSYSKPCFSVSSSGI